MTDTEEKILAASIQLFAQKGFDRVTTKEIAQRAGVSEMTLFRHFHNKLNLFKCAYARYNNTPEFKSVLRNKLQGDIAQDLLTISRCYQEALIKNQKLILLQLRNGEMAAENNPLSKLPDELIKLLTDYFTKLKGLKKIKGDPLTLSINLIAANLGLFIMCMACKTVISDIDVDRCLQAYVESFVQGIMEQTS